VNREELQLSRADARYIAPYRWYLCLVHDAEGRVVEKALELRKTRQLLQPPAIPFGDGSKPAQVLRSLRETGADIRVRVEV
jgi:hypothetical protein